MISTPTKRVKFIALALPLAITVGCGQKSQIIDYTLSMDEYAALTEPAPLAAPTATAQEQIAFATEEAQTFIQEAPQIVLATSPPQLPEQAEPVMAAALPAEQFTYGQFTDEQFTEVAHSLDSPPPNSSRPNSGWPNSSWTEEPMMPATNSASMEHTSMPSITAAEMASLELNSQAGAAALEATAVLEAKVAQLEATAVLEAKGAQLEATAALEAKVAQLEALTAAPVNIPEPELASAFDIDRLGFTPSVYTTVGLGVSRMNPDTSTAEGWEPNDITEPAGQLGIGVDIGRFLSVEAHSADYGSTSLNPEGRINYHVNGVSALIYAGKNLDRFRRRGFNGYARIGFNQIENTTIGDVPFLNRKSNHASFGVGAEYTTRIGLGMRADLIAYDGDVQYGQLGILYRLASKPSILPKLAAATDAPAPPEFNYPELNADMPAMDSTFEMAESKPPYIEDVLLSQPRYTTEHTVSDDCTNLNGTLSNVNFMNGSAELTSSASRALDNVADTLMGCAQRQIVVSAHTDSNGSAVANDALSKRRARAVAMHLTSRGIHRDRMRAVAFGESQPVATNATPEGRTRNRRVELEVR